MFSEILKITEDHYNMKGMILLLLLNLKTLVKKMPLYFIMIMSVLFFTIIGTMVIYNYYISSTMEKDNSFENTRSYSVAGSFFDIDNQLEALVENSRPVIQRVYVVIKNNDDTIISNYFGESQMLFKVRLGRYLDDESANQIIIPHSTQNGVDLIGKEYSIGNREFLIVGISSIDAYEILYKSLEEKEKIEQVVVVAESNLKEREKNKLVDDINHIFQTEEINMPANISTEMMHSDYFIMIGVILLGILNISFIYISIMEKRKKQRAIFYILGCRKPQLIALCLGEIFIITTISFLLCAGFSKFILFNIINAFDEFFYHALSLNQYFSLYLIYTLLIVFVLLYQLVKFFGKTPIELKRK